MFDLFGGDDKPKGFDFAGLEAEISKCVTSARHERGAQLVRDFCAEHPEWAALIRAAFSGTPAEAREQFLTFFPGLAPVLSVDFVGRVQAVLQHEWTKPRF